MSDKIAAGKARYKAASIEAGKQSAHQRPLQRIAYEDPARRAKYGVKITRGPAASAPGNARAKVLAERTLRASGGYSSHRSSPSAGARVAAAAGALAPRAKLFSGGSGKKVAASLRGDARVASHREARNPGFQATRAAQMPPALKGVSGWAIWRAKNKWRVK